MMKIFPWIALLSWMAIIFYFSHQPATVSNELNTVITKGIIEKVQAVISISDSDIASVNRILRKNAHFFIYLILGLIVSIVLKKIGTGKIRIGGFALLVCVLYAVSDEFHQYFVEGRGPQIKDVLIDSAGAIVGICLFFVMNRLVRGK